MPVCSVNNNFAIMKELFSEYVNPEVVDQGAPGNCGVKDIVDNSTSEKINLIFRTEDPNTIYIFSTNITLGENVNLDIHKGAYLSIDSGVILSIYSPENIKASPRQKIKIGNGNIVFQKAGMIAPAWYGIVGNGIIDDSTAFNEINASMIAGSVVRLLPGANYYLNGSNGIIFNKKVELIGYDAQFTCGQGIGNSPAITISGEKSYLAGFEVVGDHTNFTNGNLDTVEFRRGIKITADHVMCENLIDSSSIVGISIEGADFCTIKGCISTNDIIVAGMAANNYNAGFRLKDANNCKIIGNYISGHGNAVLQGGWSFYNSIINNTIEDCDNNGIYISSGQWNKICQNTIKRCDGSGIKARDSYHLISDNVLDQDGWTGGLVGISITGNGVPDASGFNGENTIVSNNIIKGRYTAAIRVGVQDGGYLRNPHIIGNSIEMTGDPELSLYGINVKGRSQGTIINDNQIKNPQFGIYLSTDDSTSDFHRSVMICNNHLLGSEQYGIIANNFSGSAIEKNTIRDSGRYVVYVTNSDDVSIAENRIIDFYHAISASVAISIGGNNHSIKNNYIERTNVGGIAYGIRLENQSRKVSIIGNTFKTCDYGIFFLMANPATDYHEDDIVSGNLFTESDYGGIYGTKLSSCLITNNEFHNAGEEVINILDSSNVTISYNMIKDDGDPGHTTMNKGIIVRGNSYQIIGNKIEVYTSAIHGIVAYGYGPADSENYNGYNTEIKSNHVIGPFTTAIATLADDYGYYLKNPKIVGNTIEIKSGGAYGIRFDGRTSGASIIENNITGHNIGIYTTIDSTSDTHSKMLIKGNNTSGATNDGIILYGATRSLITNNISMNCAATRTGMTLVDSVNNQIINNLCGDDQSVPTQRYGIEEQGSSDYNMFINNDCEGLTISGIYRYVINGPNSLVDNNKMIVETLTGNRTFEIGEAKTYILDPGGSNRNFNPRAVTWSRINMLTIVNTADAAETITFDSSGLNQAITQGERGIFTHDGANWLKIYVGS